MLWRSKKIFRIYNQHNFHGSFRHLYLIEYTFYLTYTVFFQKMARTDVLLLVIAFCFTFQFASSIHLLQEDNDYLKISNVFQ